MGGGGATRTEGVRTHLGVVFERHVVACRADADTDQAIVRDAAGERGLLFAVELGEAVEPEGAVDEAAEGVDELGHVAGYYVVFLAEAGLVSRSF